jgi:hypothetical protein
VAALKHRFSLFQRGGMIEFRGHRAPVPLQDFADQKKIFFLIPHQEYRQE